MENKFEIIIPTLFGMEAFVSREVRRLGYETTSVEDGRVVFMGDYEAVCRANLWIRTGERVLIKLAEFNALSFEELFEEVYSIRWQDWLPADAAFPVKGYSLKSQLTSVPSCQSIIKKAAAKKMWSAYGIEHLPENGSLYQIQFSILKDRVTIMLDTSGEPLHKRGYRRLSNAAPLRETIAAAMITMSYWKFEQPFLDPFCGSGTIPIEAAMFKRNIAPGINRRFAAEEFKAIPTALWSKARAEARDSIYNVPLEIYASDLDPECVELSRANAKNAGVDEFISISKADARKVFIDKPDGTIICNPPYGERMGEIKECERLYRDIGKSFNKMNNWAKYILVPNENFEKLFGMKADKKRKLYNGMLKCNVYQYFSKRR
ncbi:MAG: class I SAM-dependent RNA methyltransferase [bacterium]|nr:class I SAM-dependent RNA methyltransferase [bacterium]